MNIRIVSGTSPEDLERQINELVKQLQRDNTYFEFHYQATAHDSPIEDGGIKYSCMIVAK